METVSNFCKNLLSNLDQDHKIFLRIIIFLFPLIFIFYAVILKSLIPKLYYKLMIKEDGLIENATAIFYFLSSFVSFAIATTFYRRKLILYSTLYFLLFIGLFFIGMEEISWGQRFFGVATPELLTNYNYQGEFNVHNIEGFPLHLLYIIVGCYGGFARFFIPKKVKIKYMSTVNLFVPDYFLFFYFFSVGALYLYYDYLSSIVVCLLGDEFGWGVGRFIRGKDQEPAEFLLSCGFFLFVIINRWRQINAERSAIVRTRL